MNTRGFKLLLLLLAVAATMLAGCSRDAEVAPAHAVPYVAVARGRVNVEGGLLNLGMPMEGTLTEVAVHEGEKVKQGQLLARADPTAARIQLSMAQAKLDQAQVQGGLLAARQRSARTRARRLAEAASAGAGDLQSAEDAGDAVTQLGAELAASRATVSLARAEFEQSRYLLARQTLSSPIDALVLKVNAQKGSNVSPQSGPLFSLLPVRPFIVRAELNESLVSAVRTGMSAQVSDDYGQTILGTAHVLRIGSIFGPSTLQDESDSRVGERSVECVLTMDGNPPLKVGERVLVRFLAVQAVRAAAAPERVH